MLQVGGKSVLAACQGPGINVMDIEDVVLISEIVGYRFEVLIRRRPLHEDVNGFANDANRGPEQHDPECSPEDRVDL